MNSIVPNIFKMRMETPDMMAAEIYNLPKVNANDGKSFNCNGRFFYIE